MSKGKKLRFVVDLSVDEEDGIEEVEALPPLKRSRTLHYGQLERKVVYESDQEDEQDPYTTPQKQIRRSM